MNNLALLRAHVLIWSFDVAHGKAAFKMSAKFKNDISKHLIHTIADTADDILASVDSMTSIFTKHIQNFIDKLKNYLPLDANAFLGFITKLPSFGSVLLRLHASDDFSVKLENFLRTRYVLTGFGKKLHPL